jgi:integrase
VLLPARKEKGLRGHHPALPFDKIGAFMSILRERPAVAARGLELLILTAARTNEVRLARWSEIDLDRAVWTIPASRMNMKREHRVPLSHAAVALLRPLWIANADPDALVFPGQKPGHPMSNMAMEMLLRRLAIKQCTVHGFRSTFLDWAGECTQYPREIAEAALAHPRIIDPPPHRPFRRWNECIASGVGNLRRKISSADGSILDLTAISPTPIVLMAIERLCRGAGDRA